MTELGLAKRIEGIWFIVLYPTITQASFPIELHSQREINS